MEHQLGTSLRALRGNQSLVSFARRLGLSYTFVREMERGNRLPSDEALVQIAERLGVQVGELTLATYCDRSPLLQEFLKTKGVVLEATPAALPSREVSNGQLSSARPLNARIL